MSLWGLLNEPKEEVKNEKVAKEDINNKQKDAEVKKTDDKIEKANVKKAKTTTKKEIKSSTNVQSLEQQLAKADKNTKIIYNYLITIPGMEEKMKNPNKSLRKMNAFIRNKARNMAVDGCAVVEDKEVFGWAVHYYDEENPE